VVGAFTAGQLARKLGRVKAIILGGLFLAAAGFLLLAFLGASTSHWLSAVDMTVVGFGIGITMPSALVIVQNAAERRDVGVATGTLLFLRSMGAALGSTLVGTLLAARFAAGLRAAGGNPGIDLGALRGQEGTGVTLPAALHETAMAALANGFHMAFLACAGLAAVGLIACLGLRDLPLQSSEKH
jgi:MFS family permease